MVRVKKHIFEIINTYEKRFISVKREKTKYINEIGINYGCLGLEYVFF